MYTIGDAHVYMNHLDQIDEQLTREPYSLPRLHIRRKPDSIFDYEYEDFELIDYQYHPGIMNSEAQFYKWIPSLSFRQSGLAVVEKNAQSPASFSFRECGRLRLYGAKYRLTLARALEAASCD